MAAAATKQAIMSPDDIIALLPPKFQRYIQVVRRMPVAVGPWALIETDACQIWPVVGRGDAQEEEILKVMRDRLDRMTIEAVVKRHTREVVGIETKKRNGSEVRKHLNKDKCDFAVNDIHGYVSEHTIATTEFLHEAILGQALAEALKDKTPHLTATHAAFLVERDDQGAILMDRVTCTLHDALKDKHGFRMQGADVAGVYFVILHSLSLAQQVCKLKHHDLHDKNVFIKKITSEMEWRGQKLADATHFKYTVGPDHSFYLPNLGYIAQLADFGLSSAVVDGISIERVDLELIGADDSDEEDEAWGEWTPNLHKRRGYDAQVFFSEDPVSSKARLANDNDLADFTEHALECANAGVGRTTDLGRPSVVTDLPPDRLLLALYASSGVKYDFTTAPTGAGACVVHMAHTDIQAYTPAVVPVSGKKSAKGGAAAGGGGGGGRKKKGAGMQGRTFSPNKRRKGQPRA